MESEDLQFLIVSNALKKMNEKESTLKTNQKILRMFYIMMTIWKATII